MKAWFKQQPVENLEEWLKIANKDLCESAKTRIALEIETHYKEAVEAHLRENRPAVEAEALALEELGGPKAAARRFRKKHLTEKENEKLVQLATDASKRQSKSRYVIEFICFVGLIAAIPLVYGFFRTYSHPLVMAWCLALNLLWYFPYTWASRFLAKSLSQRLLIGCLVLAHALSELIWCCANSTLWILVMQPAPITLGIFISLSAVVPTMLVLIHWLRMWQKVRNDKAGWIVAHSGSKPTSAS